MSYSDIVLPTRQTASINDSNGLCGATNPASSGTLQRCGAGSEELLGGRVDHADFAVAVDDDDRIGKRRQHRRRFRQGEFGTGAAPAPAEILYHAGSPAAPTLSCRASGIGFR